MKNYEYLVDAISTPTDDCIVWPYSKDGRGYGRVWDGTKVRHAYLIALEHATPCPEGKVCAIKGDWVPGHKLQAAHGPCHNPACFNPKHLSWSTKAENAADRKRDGTHIANEDHVKCKVPNADVALIRELYKGPRRGKRPETGPTLRELAEQFGCSKSQVHAIVNEHQRTSPVNAQPNEELQQV